MTRASSYRADDAVGNAMIRGTRQRSLSFFGHHLRCICLSFVFLLAAASSHVAPTQTAPDDVNTSPWSWSSVGMRTLGWFEKPFRPKTSICTPCRGYCPTRDICKVCRHTYCCSRRHNPIVLLLEHLVVHVVLLWILSSTVHVVPSVRRRRTRSWLRHRCTRSPSNSHA